MAAVASDDLFEGLLAAAARRRCSTGRRRRARGLPLSACTAAAADNVRAEERSQAEKPSSDAASSSPAAAAAADAAAEGLVPEKRLRFRTTVDASEMQIIEPMHKITSHIGNPSKFNKASKLVLQLIETGSIKPRTVRHFFAILEAAMSSPGACNEPSVPADYQALFNAAQGCDRVLW
ncbi:hypothetical protein GUJ93_ZPchr0006g41158 [Zizania palustris]|uniref:Uncharacterized protein n=1 Tax=Zizania palustris TaxID=103762 RepID=A0A8J5W2C6_ZIZPA|nr:hypothetical protein GUJ93_ZPchr0006g41158 [Zizania palustris]